MQAYLRGFDIMFGRQFFHAAVNTGKSSGKDCSWIMLNPAAYLSQGETNQSIAYGYPKSFSFGNILLRGS